MEETKEATIVGGPIALKGYDKLVLAQDHTAQLPSGGILFIPAGTMLYRIGPTGDGVTLKTGTAEKVGA